MEKIFSGNVFAATLPNPTDVKLEQVKYRAVAYLSAFETEVMFVSNFSARPFSQPGTIRIIYRSLTNASNISFRRLIKNHFVSVYLQG